MTDDRGTCQHCPASRDGCQARQAFARQRCCWRCSHGELVGVSRLPAPSLFFFSREKMKTLGSEDISLPASDVTPSPPMGATSDSTTWQRDVLQGRL